MGKDFYLKKNLNFRNVKWSLWYPAFVLGNTWKHVPIMLRWILPIWTLTMVENSFCTNNRCYYLGKLTWMHGSRILDLWGLVLYFLMYLYHIIWVIWIQHDACEVTSKISHLSFWSLGECAEDIVRGQCLCPLTLRRTLGCLILLSC